MFLKSGKYTPLDRLLTLIFVRRVGSGLVLTSFVKMLEAKLSADDFKQVKFYGTDINPLALAETKDMMERNKVDLSQVNLVDTCLGTGLEPASFDIIIFNPPYVVTPAEELKKA